MQNNRVIAPGFNLPPILFKDKVVIINSTNNSALEFSGQSAGNLVVTRQFPLTFKVAGFPDFTFPIDPLVSLSFKNVISRRTVAKGNKRGTIKERFTSDDVEIIISGVFISNDENYPEEVDKLREYCEVPIAIKVDCTLINNRGIDSIVIDAFDLPATSGVNNQAFQIRAYSDDVYNLLIKV